MGKKPKPVAMRAGVRLKQPVVAQVSSDKMHPKFSFEHLDRDYCISKLVKEEKAALADTLRKLSSLTWRELRQDQRHGLGYERISGKAIHRPLPARVTEDVTDFVAFRFYGKLPMVGYKLNEVLFVVWLDRNATLYDH